MSRPTYAIAIERAFERGYKVDADLGVIYGLSGRRLSIKLHGTQRYPTVPLAVLGMPRRVYVVPAHKMVAFAVWGWAAFAAGVHVRHGRGGVLDVRRVNLSLGSPSDNEMDKPSENRRRAARSARQSQGARGAAVKVADSQWQQVVLSLEYGPTGRVKRGIVSHWAEVLGVSKTCVSDGIRNYLKRNSHE